MSEMIWEHDTLVALTDLQRACLNIYNLTTVAIADHSHILVHWEEAFKWLLHDVLPAMVVEMELRGEKWTDEEARELVASFATKL